MSPRVPIVPCRWGVTQLPPNSPLLREAKLFAGLLVGGCLGWSAVPKRLGDTGTMSCLALTGQAGAEKAGTAFHGLEQGEISQVWATTWA